MKHRITILLLFLAVFMTGAGVAAGHAVRGDVRPADGLQVKARYDDGEAMSYAAVEIFFEDEDLAFQKGRTDRNGRFLFLPDKVGTWRITVNDGMGHQLSLQTTVDDAANLSAGNGRPAPEAPPGGLSKGTGVLIGLAVIFGLFGFFFWWRGLKRAGKGQNEE